MGWEDGYISNVEILIDQANRNSGEKAKSFLNEALSSAKLIKNDYKKKNYIALIEDKLKNIK